MKTNAINTTDKQKKKDKKEKHGNAGVFRPSIRSPHFYGQTRSETEQRELERLDREKKECAIVRRACNAFFDRRGLSINSTVEPPEWDYNLIQSCFDGAPIKVLS